MKNINFKNIPFQIILAFLFVTQWVQAESGFGFEDDVQDVHEAPIDNYMIPAIVVMVLFGLYIIYKRDRQIKV